HQQGSRGHERHRLGSVRRSRHPAGAGSRSRQHASQTADFPAQLRCRRAGAGRARADHPEQPRRQRAHQTGQLRSGEAGRAGAPRRSRIGDSHSMKTRALLVMNAGSSSIKFCVYYLSGHSSTGDVPAGDRLEAGLRGQIEGIGTARPHLSVRENGNRRERALSSAEAGTPQAATALLAEAVAGYSAELEVVAVGHRIVHGGMRYSAPVQLDATVLDYLDTLNPLAPLQQPHNTAAVPAIAQALPDPQPICRLATAFHQRHGTVNDMFALPYAMYEAGVRRYGFHGLSYEYIAGALPDLAPTIAGKRVIAAHLGNGASLCAINGGRSVDSTMGFSALDGLPMGTRCGQLDPGVILYLLRERGMTAGDLEALFYKQSGLLGISGISADMRDLLASEEPRA